MTEPMAQADLIRKLVVRTTIWLILLGLLLFGAAGTLRWPQAWIYLAWAAAISFGGGLWLARHDPALLNERLGSVIQRDQKGWDKLFMVMVLVLWFAWFALMGLDVRYRWSHVPLYAQIIGFLLLILGCYLVWLTFRANSFAAPVVKIQKERAHRVITERTLRLCSPSDVCRRPSDQYRRAASPRLVVGALGRCPVHRVDRRPRRARGAHAQGRACGLCRLREPRPLPARALSVVTPSGDARFSVAPCPPIKRAFIFRP